MSLRSRIIGIVALLAVASAPLMGSVCKPGMQMSMMPTESSHSDHEDCGMSMIKAQGCCLEGGTSQQPPSAVAEKFTFKLGFLATA